jgi:aminopeptidase N
MIVPRTLKVLLFAVIVLPGLVRARPAHTTEARRLGSPSSAGSLASLASSWYDVTFYALNLRISASPPMLSGAVTIRGICNQNLPHFLVLDLANAMHVDSVKVGGSNAGFTQQLSTLSLTIDSAYRLNDPITVAVFYRGVPQPTGFGSFVFDSHNGTPWVWSLSEPYGARDWWPCKDYPGDKADSADITVTCDSSFRVGSNGRLAGVTMNGDGTQTTYWQERYPIAAYLISVNVSNFVQFSNWFRYSPTESLQVLNYVLPESLASAQVLLPNAVEGLRIFSSLFGLYPFIREKYGHSQFDGGGMEHQTMTSLTDFNEETVVHELAHQWFGDMITCRTWSNLWLNEGFATYCTALYEEKKYGPETYRAFMNYRMEQARAAVGPVIVQDTTIVRNLFNSDRVYSKGAAALHMLRHILGDSAFFGSMRAYANDPTLKYGTATTEDFQRACEATSGRNLQFFFDEWLYGENYPHYSYGWDVVHSSGGYALKVSIIQSTGTDNPRFFTMPLHIRAASHGWDSTITVWNDQPEQVYAFTVPVRVESLQLDPGGWVLKEAIALPLIPEPTEFRLSQNYPNPFNTATRIEFSVPHRARLRLDVYNILGQRVATLADGVRTLGSYSVEWDGSGVPSGIYICRLEAVTLAEPLGMFRDERKLLLIR